MKRTLSLVALVAMAAVAGPLKVGGDLSGVLNLPSFDPSVDGVTAKMGFGVKVAPAVEYAINDQVSVRGNVGYDLTMYSAEIDMGALGKITGDATSHLLTIDVQGQYSFTKEFFAGVGVGYDVNLSSKMSVDGTSSDDTNKANPFVVEASLGYKFMPELGVVAGYQFPITGISDGDGSKTKVMKVTLGLRYDMAL